MRSFCFLLPSSFLVLLCSYSSLRVSSCRPCPPVLLPCSPVFLFNSPPLYSFKAIFTLSKSVPNNCRWAEPYPNWPKSIWQSDRISPQQVMRVNEIDQTQEIAMPGTSQDETMTFVSGCHRKNRWLRWLVMEASLMKNNEKSMKSKTKILLSSWQLMKFNDCVALMEIRPHRPLGRLPDASQVRFCHIW